jgi:hypothetical protein
MIHKNVKFGKIPEVTVVELGKGDVNVCSIVLNNSFTGISFVNRSPCPIGTVTGDKDKPMDEVGVDMVILFTRYESLLVVERALIAAKKAFINIRNSKNPSCPFDNSERHKEDENCQKCAIYNECDMPLDELFYLE